MVGGLDGLGLQRSRVTAVGDIDLFGWNIVKSRLRTAEVCGKHILWHMGEQFADGEGMVLRIITLVKEH